MSHTIRRFVAVASLSVALALPLAAAPSRDGGKSADREIAPIQRVIRIVKRFFKLNPTEVLTPPIPVDKP